MMFDLVLRFESDRAREEFFKDHLQNAESDGEFYNAVHREGNSVFFTDQPKEVVAQSSPVHGRDTSKEFGTFGSVKEDKKENK